MLMTLFADSQVSDRYPSSYMFTFVVQRLEVVKFAQKCCEMPFDTQLVLDESEVMSVVSDRYRP